MMVTEIDGMERDWEFKPSSVPRWKRRQIVETFVRAIHWRPAWCEIKAVRRKPRWVVYFLFAPEGALSPTHRFTLGRLRDLGLPVLVVCGCALPSQVPADLPGYCDALYWKALPGYDFSAYSLALQQIGHKSPDADVLVMNDSVFGPFTDLRPMLARAAWGLTGFTASNQLTEHIQSYAFFLRGVNRRTMMRLAPVFFPLAAISDRDAVILLQETRLARVAARSMRVGAFWYADTERVLDPSIVRPVELIDAGFPFVKRRLMGTPPFPHVDQHLLGARLRDLGHPADWPASPGTPASGLH